MVELLATPVSLLPHAVPWVLDVYGVKLLPVTTPLLRAVDLLARLVLISVLARL